MPSSEHHDASGPHVPLLSSPLRNDTQATTITPSTRIQEGSRTSRTDPSLTIDPVTLAYSYSYGPSGLAGLRHNYYALICACLASIGGLSFGYDQGVIASVLVMSDFKKRWPITSFQIGAMTAMLELGALVGAILAGIFADRYSRRHSIFVACIIFCIGSSFQCGAQSLSDIFFGRAIGGIGVGALSTLSPLYMAEISPPELRGSLTAIEQFSIVLGVVFGFWTGFFTRSVAGSFSWRIPLAIQIIPGIILALGCIYLPPSPRLLVLQGRYDEALQSLAKLRGVSVSKTAMDERLYPVLHVELLEMKVEASVIQRLTFLHDADADTTKSSLTSEWKAWKRLFSRKYRERTLIGVLIMFFQQWSGINALLYYGPILMKSVGLGSENSNGSEDDTATLIVSGGIGIVQFLSVFPVILIIDKLGSYYFLLSIFLARVLMTFHRTKTFTAVMLTLLFFGAEGGSILMTFSHLTIALLVYQFSDNWTQHRSAAWICVCCMYLFTASYGISFGPVGWVLPSEVFPSSIRSKGVALSIASNWINNFLIGLITPLMMEISPPFTFGTFSIACFIAYFWSTYRVPETAKLSLEEMDAVFQDGVGREDQEIRTQIEEDMGLRGLIREVAEGYEDVEVRGSQ